MNNRKKIVNEFKKNKYKYIFLITIVVLGFISGIIFSNILSYNDKKEVSEVVETYFINLKNNEQINYISNLFNIIENNFFYIILIVIFSFSIIGIILNPFILYFKSFVIGISVGLIMSIYSFKGIIFSFLYVIPHQIINLIIYILLSYYGINLGIKLFKTLFLKKTFNISSFMKKYFKILILSFVIILISSLYETFFADFIMKLFTFLI